MRQPRADGKMDEKHQLLVYFIEDHGFGAFRPVSAREVFLPVKWTLALDKPDAYAPVSKFGVKRQVRCRADRLQLVGTFCLQPKYLSSLQRYMTEQELDLLQFATRFMTEPGTRPPVMPITA